MCQVGSNTFSRKVVTGGYVLMKTLLLDGRNMTLLYSEADCPSALPKFKHDQLLTFFWNIP
jgi:hypothetical protein